MTTIKLHGGDLGAEAVLVRCNLSQAESPVEIDYGHGEGWQSTPYQSSDCRRTVDGLKVVAKTLAAQATEIPERQLSVNVDEAIR